MKFPWICGAHALAMVLFFSLSAPAKELNLGAPFDLQGFVDGELDSGNKRIVIPAGRHRVTPRNRVHLRLAGLENVEIDARGAELICTETTRTVTIENCANVTLRGLVIDYDPLPFTQGKIVEISPDGLTHDIELFAGYPFTGRVEGKKYEIFTPDTRTLRFGSYYGCAVTGTGPGRLRVVKPEHYRNKQPERVGDIIAIDCGNAPGGSIPHAVYVHNSREVTLDSITLYASNSFGFFESECGGTVYQSCVVDRRPAAMDLKHRFDPRVRSLNADAFHSKHASVGPRYFACRARFQGDDCVAINGDYHMVTACDGKALRVLAKREMNIAAGDTVELVSYSGERHADARVVSVSRDGEISGGERAFLSAQSMNEDLKNSRHGRLTRAYRVVLESPVSLPMGSLIASTNRLGNGFKVVDCVFGFNRSRGILVKASKGEIVGNVLEGCWMEAIKLAPEYWWLEAGSGIEVSIRDNVIRNCFNRAISVTSTGGDGSVSPTGAHRDIVISGNRIEDSPAPRILVTSTEGLTIVENTFVSSAGETSRLEDMIALERVHGVRVEGNEVSAPTP